MYTYMYMYIYLYVYLHAYVYIHAYACARVYVCMFPSLNSGLGLQMQGKALKIDCKLHFENVCAANGAIQGNLLCLFVALYSDSCSQRGC